VKNNLDLGFSPCPNDTHIFYDFVKKNHFRIHIHDVEDLNQKAFKCKYDVSKISFYAWYKIKKNYQLLNYGAALGRGCGPLLITKSQKVFNQSFVVAIPGEFTTAHLLFRLCYKNAKSIIFMPFDKIMDALENGYVDAAVIIHEGRFTFESRGFRCEQDLGDWWENETQLPIPLGCIVAKKILGEKKIFEIEEKLSDSIQYALKNPTMTYEYVKKYAQEMDDEVICKHIKTYVNNYTLDLSSEGHRAIIDLESKAKKAGLI